MKSIEDMPDNEISPRYLRQQVSFKAREIKKAFDYEGIKVNPLKFLLMDYYIEKNGFYEC